MTEEVLKASDAADFAVETRLIVLPRPGAGGKPLAVRIRPAPLSLMVARLEGIPGMDLAPGDAKEQDWTKVRASIIQNEGPLRQVAELGVVEPPMSFKEREDGKVFWEDVHYFNQIAIVFAILELSGLMEKGEGAAATAAAFPAGDDAGA